MEELTAPPGATAPVFYEQEEHAHGDGGTLIGFWMYLMSDSLIFAALFATYGVLGRNYAAGPSGADLFDLRLVALNTAFLLLSSLTYGFAMLAMDGAQTGTPPPSGPTRTARRITRGRGRSPPRDVDLPEPEHLSWRRAAVPLFQVEISP